MTPGFYSPGPAVLPSVAVPSLARSGDLPVATAVALLVESGEVAFRGIPLGHDPNVQTALVDAQVAPADLVSLAEAYWAVPCISEAISWLDQIARPYPAIGVRDALGWALGAVEAAVPRTNKPPPTPSSPVLPLAWVRKLIGPWERVGLADRGWLYRGAGFTPAEAAAARDAGTLDEQAAVAMAALRGARLPA